MIWEAKDLAEEVSVSVACKTLGIPRSTFYYAQKPKKPSSQNPHPRKLSEEEETEIKKELNSERFQEQTIIAIYAKGTSTKGIQVILEILDGIGVSTSTIGKITDRAWELMEC